MALRNRKSGNRDLKEKFKMLVKDLKRYEPEKIIVFGSASRGDIDEYSDIDLLVIKDTKKNFVDRLVEVITYVRAELCPVDILVYNKGEFKKMKEEFNPFIEQVLKDGKVIYEKG